MLVISPGIDVVTIGAPADSFFEYLVKSWVMTSQRDTQAAEMYFKVMEAFEDTLLQTTNDGLKYFAEMTNGLVHRMGHLVRVQYLLANLTGTYLYIY